MTGLTCFQLRLPTTTFLPERLVDVRCLRLAQFCVCFPAASFAYPVAIVHDPAGMLAALFTFNSAQAQDAEFGGDEEVVVEPANKKVRFGGNDQIVMPPAGQMRSKSGVAVLQFLPCLGCSLRLSNLWPELD